MFCVLTEKLEAFYRNVVQSGTKRGPDDGRSRGDVMSFSTGESAYYLSWLPAEWSEGLIVLFIRKKAFMRAGAAATCFLTTSHSHKRWPVRRKSEPRAPHWQRVREVHRFKRSLVAPHEEESNTLHNGAIFIQGDRLQSASRWKWKRSISSSASWASMMLTMMAAWVTIAAFSVAEPLHASGELKRKVHRPRQTLIRQPNPPPSQHRSTKLNAVIQSVQNTLACLSMAPRPPRPPLTG